MDGHTLTFVFSSKNGNLKLSCGALQVAKCAKMPKSEKYFWKALDKPIEIEPQVLPVYKREGFTLVEWGGTEIY